jgi:hypothetical protein
MSKRYRVLLLASVAAALAVPVGFALSLESDSAPMGAFIPVVAFTSPTPPVLVSTQIVAPSPSLPLLPEGAQLAVAGGILLGIATVVRRAGKWPLPPPPRRGSGYPLDSGDRNP